MRSQIHQIVAAAASARGDSPALTFKSQTVGYGELWEGIVAFGAALERGGLERGDRVAVYLDKQVETVVALLGASAGGGVFVPVNPLLRPAQVGHVLRDCTARVVVTSVERHDLIADELERCPSVERVVVVGAGTAARAAGRRELVGWDELVGAGRASRRSAPSAIDVDPAAILYTSGSTGRPKGVVVSHRNLLAGGASVSEYLGNRPDDRILAVLPLSFDAGLSQLTTAFTVGAHAVLMNYLLPGDVVRLCAEHAITGLTCVPPLWIQLAGQQWPVEATRAMRYFANTGGRMPRPTLDALRATFPQASPYLMYGLTEAFRSTYLDPAQVDARPDSIGKAIPNAEVLVVRPDGTPCAPGEEGELVHRGALVALGYWDDPERTAERFRPAPGRDSAIAAGETAVWSGDVVVADEEGFLYFVGRRDELIKTSGYRVSPTEIEEVAYATRLVGDVVALGIEDPQLGQRVVLIATPADGAELDSGRLLAELRQELPVYMVPREIEPRSSLPRSPNGKLDRAALRAELESRS